MLDAKIRKTKLSSEKQKISIVTTSIASINAFLAPHIISLSKNYEVTINTKIDKQQLSKNIPSSVRIEHFSIERKIYLIKDLYVLFVLLIRFWRQRPKLVLSQTPKAGLIAAIAAYGSGIPTRVHIFTGQVWATRRGVGRFILKSADMFVAKLSTHMLADSESQRKFLIDQGIVAPERIRVLANGSISGVDTVRFTPDFSVRSMMRSKLNIPEKDIVFLFVGRLNSEKGIPELARAFSRLSEKMQDISLVLVGEDEENIFDLVKSITSTRFLKVHLIKHTSVPQDFMAMADVFCLPSHREGFGTAIIEAASCGVPAIGTNIYGISDAIVNGETGILVPVNCDFSLEKAMLRMAKDTEWRKCLGLNARTRAVSKFSSEIVVQEMYDYLVALIEQVES